MIYTEDNKAYLVEAVPVLVGDLAVDVAWYPEHSVPRACSEGALLPHAHTATCTEQWHLAM